MKRNIQEKIKSIIPLLRKHTKSFTPPLVDQIITEFGHDPYLILISCLLSLRAKDIVTIHVCRTLFKRVRTPQELLSLSQKQLEQIIFKSGFYKNKAQVLREVSKTILDKYHGKVPCSEHALLSIKGIGRKTANLVLGLACNIRAICVDIHVHRISNRLGLITTKTPEETELALEKILPQCYWTEWNKLLVTWGQNVCTPRVPKCSQCAIKHLCKQVGVTKKK